MTLPTFPKYATTGDAIRFQHDGFTVDAWIEHDYESTVDDDDSHNTDQSVTGCDDEQQKMLIAARDAWFENEWFYGCLFVRVSVGSVELAKTVLGGLEINYPNSTNAYLTDTAKELADEIKDEAHKNAIDQLKSLAQVIG